MRQERAPPILGTFQKPVWLKEEVKGPYMVMSFEMGLPTIHAACPGHVPLTPVAPVSVGTTLLL